LHFDVPFPNNQADRGGGGMAAWEGDMTLVNSTVSGNIDGNTQAGDVYGNYSSISLNSSTISENNLFGVESTGLISVLHATNTIHSNNKGTGLVTDDGGQFGQDRLSSSTIAGNGGFGVRSNGASIALSKSMISDNASSGLEVEGVCDYESYKITLNSTLYLKQHWLWYLSRVGATATG
jgi:hypothetical protein